MQPNNNLNSQQLVKEIKKTLKSNIVYSKELIKQFSKELKNLKKSVLTLKIYSYKKLEIRSEELEVKAKKLAQFSKTNKNLLEMIHHINYLKAYIPTLWKFLITPLK